MEATSPQPQTPSPEEAAAAAPPADEKVVDISETKKPKKMSAHQIREQQKLAERIRRWQNKNEAWPASYRKAQAERLSALPADQVEREVALAFEQAALRHIQREDYEKLPADKKIARIEKMLVQFSQGIVGDIQALQYNDRAITEIFDVNLRAIARMFEHLGISKEKQADILEAVQAEILAEQQEKEKKMQEAREKAAAQALNEAVDAPAGAEDELPPPPEATEFE